MPVNPITVLCCVLLIQIFGTPLTLGLGLSLFTFYRGEDWAPETLSRVNFNPVLGFPGLFPNYLLVLRKGRGRGMRTELRALRLSPEEARITLRTGCGHACKCKALA